MKNNALLSHSMISAAIEVRRHIGPGLLEAAYEQCMCTELIARGVDFKRQVLLPVNYKGVKLNCGYRMDLVVEDEVAVELKAIKELEKIHEAQLLAYLRLAGIKPGLLLNFNVLLMKNGIKRIANGL